MKTKYDVITIGAGPAGSTFAKYTAKLGYTLALIDGSHPREKPCGGLVEQEAIDEFGILSEVIDRRPKGYIFITKDGNIFDTSKLVKKSIRRNGTVSRQKFDGWLLEEAKNSGADHLAAMAKNVIERNGKYIVKTKDGRTISGKYLAIADGVNSKFRKKIFGWDPATEHLSECYLSRMYFSKNYIDETFDDLIYMIYLKPLLRGFGWVIPRSDHISIGVGDELPRSEVLKKAYEELITHPELKDKLKNPIGIQGPYQWKVPSIRSDEFFDINRAAKENAVLLGDASLLVDPITFEGITFAMRSGKYASECLKEDGSFRDYEKKCKERIGPQMKKAVFVGDIEELVPEAIEMITKLPEEEQSRFWKFIKRLFF